MAKKSASKALQDAPVSGERSRMWARPGFLLRRVNQIHYGLFFEECGAGLVTPLQFGVLTVLMENEDGMDIGALAFQLGTDRSNTADVTRRLASRGYVVQETDSNDRRKLVSKLTKEGRAFLKKMEPSMQKAQERLMRPLTAAQRQTMMEALQILVRVYNDKGRAKMQI